MTAPTPSDIAIVGGGAAGLATAIFAARRCPGRSIAILEGARKIGAKILVSGGGRCNVTNIRVTPEDYFGGSRNIIRRVLNAFPAEKAASFFREIGVELYEEEFGKLFPRTDRARTVLDALLRENSARGNRVLPSHSVTAIRREAEGFLLETSAGEFRARNVVLATGGQSLPKSGSDGTGYRLARELGHGLIPTTPALAPLLLDGGFHAPLSGITMPAEVEVRAAEEKPVRLRGPFLWTHFGASGPAVMDASRLWHRARLEGKPVAVVVNFHPGEDAASMERRLQQESLDHPRLALRTVFGTLLPSRMADAILASLGIDASQTMAHLPREHRRRLAEALTAWPLNVKDSRGYNYAEATAGGVPLEEVDPSTLQSRKCPGLYFAGEILDVDGRIGGYNFQWAWSSGFVAGHAIP